MADDILTQAESAIRETERELADLLQHEVASAFDAPDAPLVGEPPRAPLNTTANGGAGGGALKVAEGAQACRRALKSGPGRALTGAEGL